MGYPWLRQRGGAAEAPAPLEIGWNLRSARRGCPAPFSGGAYNCVAVEYLSREGTRVLENAGLTLLVAVEVAVWVGAQWLSAALVGWLTLGSLDYIFLLAFRIVFGLWTFAKLCVHIYEDVATEIDGAKRRLGRVAKCRRCR